MSDCAADCPTRLCGTCGGLRAVYDLDAGPIGSRDGNPIYGGKTCPSCGLPE